MDLIDEEKTIIGLILMLSTWNFASFRYAIKTFPLNEFEKYLSSCKFGYFKNISFESVDFKNKKIKKRILELYSGLSKFEGIKYVGATKIMHFLCPKLFVMWDRKIRKHYKFQTSPDGYYSFLIQMQQDYKNGEFKNLDKNVSIPRAIDIYNMRTFSL